MSPTVELDEIFRAFDDKTRQDFQVWMQSLAVGVTGRGQDLSDAFGNLAPFADNTNDLLKILVTQQGAVQRLVRNTGEVFSALSERRGQLSGLITNANTVFQTTADKNQQLADDLPVLPTFQIESAQDAQQARRLRPQRQPRDQRAAAVGARAEPDPDLAGQLAPDLKALFIDLNPLISASRLGIPATTQILEDLTPLLGQLDPFLRQLIPITDFIAPYARAHGVLRRHGGRHSGDRHAGDGGQAGPLPAHDQPGRPGDARRVPAPGRHQPAQPLYVPRRLQAPGQPGFLQVYENRQCGAGGIPLPLSSLGVNPVLIPPALNTLIANSIFNAQGNGQTPAPPCEKQGKFTTNFGGTNEYPHVVAYPPQ